MRASELIYSEDNIVILYIKTQKKYGKKYVISNYIQIHLASVSR